jgi:hypothetical protein
LFVSTGSIKAARIGSERSFEKLTFVELGVVVNRVLEPGDFGIEAFSSGVA